MVRFLLSIRAGGRSLLFLTVIGLPLGAADARAQDLAEPLVVRHLRITGNEYISDQSLRAAIATSQSGFMARTPVLRWLGLGRTPRWDESEFRRDVLRIKALYGARGFPDAVVDTIVRRSTDHVDVDISITQNAPITVAQLTIRGASTIVPSARLREALPLAVGGPFDRLAFRTAAITIRSTLRDYGYPFVTVTSGFTEDTTARTAEITYEVEPGPHATIDEIDVVGTEQIDDRVVIQNLTIKPGDPFSEQALYDSQLALFRTNLFTYVDVTLADTVRPASGDSLATVRVRAQVLEGALRTAQIGGGYGTLDCFRFRSGLAFLDFAGDGRRLDLTARLSQIGTGSPLGAGFEQSVCPALAEEDPSRLKLNYHVGVVLHEPLLFHQHTTARVGIFAERHTEIRAFLRRTVRGDVSLTRYLSRDVPFTLTYALSFGRTEAEPATFCIFLDICRVADTRVFTEPRRRSGLSFQLTRATIGSILNPRSGSSFAFGVTWASPVIGSDTLADFLRTEAEFSSYHPLGSATLLAWRLRGGAIFAPLRQLEGGTERFIAPEERFYAGGPNSVRGFSQNELGPLTRVLQSVDTSGETPDSVIRTSATGADRLVVANLELRFPLRFMMAGLSGALFVDAGLPIQRDEFDLADLRITPGVGARLATPIGPVGLDLAVNPYPARSGPLYRVEGPELTLVESDYRPERGFLDAFRLHLSVGQAF